MATTVGIRRFTRINFEQDVKLDFGSTKYEKSTCNLSMGGLCVKGHFAQFVGDDCKIEMRQAGSVGPVVDFQAKGKVVWINGQNMAIEFTEMEYDSFLFLQTALLYQAEDPLLVSSEFGRDVNFQVLEDEEG
ncbi:PilZ domain-containing protein [Candidatus Electronema sp. PJ]|uniref:PilZ domain-containing protein n=1 Tax=Candidatus Electronema sp. PJ TaxID=3401572 RepID=UPI003AA8B8C6